jgi:rubrerythrin
MAATPSAETPNERLIRIIEGHIGSELDAIYLYRRLQTELPDPVLATIMRLIAEDEGHHHRALRQIVTALRLGGQKAQAVAPQNDAAEPAPSAPADVLTQLEAAANAEQKGASEFRQLARSEQGQGNNFVALLLDLMAMDSDKHERMLRFAVNETRRGTQDGERAGAEGGDR